MPLAAAPCRVFCFGVVLMSRRHAVSRVLFVTNNTYFNYKSVRLCLFGK